MSRVTSIARLKASLSEVLAGVKAGEEVIVTDRGRPVARILPCDPAQSGLDVWCGPAWAGPPRRKGSP